MTFEYMPSLAELIDRMNVVELKIIYSETVEAKQAFQDEMMLILSDINKHGLDANMIRAVAALAMSNVVIWENEDFIRTEFGDRELTDEEKIKVADLLMKTHSQNCDRSAAKARIQNLIKGRVDAKLNYLKGFWNIKF